MPAIRPALDTLRELRAGEVMDELAVHIHRALAAVSEHGKPAEIALTIKVKPLGTKGVSDAVEFVAEVSSKLPRAEPPSTLFFVDASGNPSRRQDRQSDLPGLSIATNEQRQA